jgi:hypothetical protein
MAPIVSRLLLLLLLVQWLCAEAAGVASPAQLQHQLTHESRHLLQPAEVSSNISSSVAGPTPALTAASCRLALRGHYADQPAVGRASISDAVTADQGITAITLSCSTTPAGLAVPVAVNSTWISAQAVQGWQAQSAPRSLLPSFNASLNCTTVFHLQREGRHLCAQLMHLFVSRLARLCCLCPRLPHARAPACLGW